MPATHPVCEVEMVGGRKGGCNSYSGETKKCIPQRDWQYGEPKNKCLRQKNENGARIIT